MQCNWLSKIRGRDARRVTIPTMFGEAAVYEMPAADGSLVRTLNVGGVLQSATYTDDRWALCPFAYLRAFDHMFEAEPHLSIRRVLMIGGAGFAYAKQLLTTHSGVQLEVVEIDPAMVDLARDQFFLDRLEAQLSAEHRSDDLHIIVEDGEAFLRNAKDSQAYDVIIVDAFVGREAVPFFASDEGIAMAKKHLTLGGLLMVNAVADYSGKAMYQLFSQVERLRSHFSEVAVIDAADEEFGGADNYLLVASGQAYPFSHTIPYGE